MMSVIKLEDMVTQISRNHYDLEHLNRRTKGFEDSLIKMVERNGNDKSTVEFILKCYQEQVLTGGRYG